MPVYQGSLPQKLLDARRQHNIGREHYPRHVVKKLVENEQIEKIANMQIVTEIEDLNPPDDHHEVPFKPIPSMLHHFDKTNLAAHSLEDIFTNYDQESKVYFRNKTLKQSIAQNSMFKTPEDVVAGANTAFKNTYMVTAMEPDEEIEEDIQVE